MIRNVYMNGKINTMFVMEEEAGVEYTHPLVEALKEQAERIDLLEKQNSELLKQEKILLNLLEMSAVSGDVMARSLKILQNMENGPEDLDLDIKLDESALKEELSVEEP
ncbi:MAG: hypothetical protein PQJ58_14085 [Spirochaetales bacterium]|nr:hypothetical protein [Spirochaetales bacterium]